jgi:clan AA aspartic protease (TIGR02281 family)
LLQSFLNAAYHDVEARLLLAEVHYGLKDYFGAIDQLYEAKGYAYQPEVLNRISKRIRVVANQLAGLFRQRGDHKGLLELYQHLTLMEPDYADYFIGLATAQLALDDREAALRSLILVSQDPVVGPQAQAMLAQLVPGDSELQLKESAALSTEVVGIPLHQRGNSFLVDARPANAGSVRLLIDTGASMTILTPDVLNRHGIRYRDTGTSSVFNTANGRVRAPIYILDVLTVGDWQVEQLEIGVLDLGKGSGTDGLLGMNFLKHFQFFIDQNDALLRLYLN